MKRVIVFRNSLLNRSETFIKEQVCTLKNWRPVLVGDDAVVRGLDISKIDSLLLISNQTNLIERLTYKICRLFGITSPFALNKLKKLNASIIHAHFGTSAVDIWPYAKKLHLPLVITLHGHDITVDKNWWKTQKKIRLRNYPEKIQQIGLHDMVSFIAVSKYIADQAASYGIPIDKIKVIYTGIDPKKFLPVKDLTNIKKNTILFVGRLVEKKGVDILIKACHLLANKKLDVTLIIVGDGPLREELQNNSKKNKVNSIFTGELPQHEVIPLMQSASLLCLPSVVAKNGNTEGFGMVLLEAQSCGTPVVSSAAGGAAEGIIHNLTGFKFEPGDYADLAEKIHFLLTNESIRIDFSDAARAFTKEKFDISKNTKILEKHYDGIIHARRD